MAFKLFICCLPDVTLQFPSINQSEVFLPFFLRLFDLEGKKNKQKDKNQTGIYLKSLIANLSKCGGALCYANITIAPCGLLLPSVICSVRGNQGAL